MPAVDQMTINVPAELQQQVEQWEDGGEYHITIQQTGQGEFDLLSIEGNEDTGEEPGPTNDTTPERINPGTVNDTGGTSIPSKNPSVVALIMSRRGKQK